MNPQDHPLKEYVITQLQSGMSSQDITTQLRTSGWSEADITAGFAAAQAVVTPTPVTTETAPVFRPEDNTHNTPSQPPQSLPEPIKRGRIMTGWLLFKQSFSIIKHNPSLYRYVIMSMAISLIIITLLGTLFVVDYNNSQTFIQLGVDSEGEETFVPTASGFVVSIVAGFIITLVAHYYATALSVHLLSIFRGQAATYQTATTTARKKFGAIAVYSLITLTVGYILNLIEERFKFIGVIVSRLLGAVWTLATSFVIPTIADTDKSGVDSLKNSVALFKKTWGETVTSRVTLSALLFIIAFAVSFVFIIILAVTAGVIGLLIGIVLMIFSFIILGVLESLATSVLNTALYYYAQYGAIPPSFKPELLASVFYGKKSKK